VQFPPRSEGNNLSVTSPQPGYAVAIYPYMAEQEDEFDVVVCVRVFYFIFPLGLTGMPEGICS